MHLLWHVKRRSQIFELPKFPSVWNKEPLKATESKYIIFINSERVADELRTRVREGKRERERERESVEMSLGGIIQN